MSTLQLNVAHVPSANDKHGILKSRNSTEDYYSFLHCLTSMSLEVYSSCLLTTVCGLENCEWGRMGRGSLTVEAIESTRSPSLVLLRTTAQCHGSNFSGVNWILTGAGWPGCKCTVLFTEWNCILSVLPGRKHWHWLASFLKEQFYKQYCTSVSYRQ